MKCRRCGSEPCECDLYPRRSNASPMDPTTALAAELVDSLIGDPRLAGHELLLALVAPGERRFTGISFACTPRLPEPALTLELVRIAAHVIGSLLQTNPELHAAILRTCANHISLTAQADPRPFTDAQRRREMRAALLGQLTAAAGSSHLLMLHDRTRHQFSHLHTFAEEDRQLVYQGLRTIAERIRAGG